MTTKKIEVYLNRRAMGNSRKRIYSLRDTATNTVKYSNSLVLIQDVEMVVQQSGRNDSLNRIATNQKITKTVHAFLRGTLMYRGRNALIKARELGLNITNEAVKSIGYDPVKTKSWLALDGYRLPNNTSELTTINHSSYALMHEDGILTL